MRRTWRWALYEKAIHRFNRRKPNQWHIDTRRHSVGYLETAGEDNTRVSSCSFQCTVCKSANVSCWGWIWVWLALSIKFFWCRGAGQTQEGIFDIIFCHFNGKNTPTFCHRRLQNQQNININLLSLVSDASVLSSQCFSSQLSSWPSLMVTSSKWDRGHCRVDWGFLRGEAGLSLATTPGGAQWSGRTSDWSCCTSRAAWGGGSGATCEPLSLGRRPSELVWHGGDTKAKSRNVSSRHESRNRRTNKSLYCLYTQNLFYISSSLCRRNKVNTNKRILKRVEVVWSLLWLKLHCG